jgi:hypothetical protein
MEEEMIAETSTRVQKHTPDYLNERIMNKTKANIALCAANPGLIENRIRELHREWDIERVLEANASSLVIIGIILGVFVYPWLYAISFLVGAFLLQHAIQGWCPPIRLFRRLGFRTHTEIATEYYALRFLRGDYRDLPQVSERDLSQAEKLFHLAKW